MYMGNRYKNSFEYEVDKDSISEWKWCNDCREMVYVTPTFDEIGDGSIPNGTHRVEEWHCPQCGSGSLEETKYCPLCGEDMSEKEVVCDSCKTDVNQALTELAENILKLDLREKKDAWLFEDIIGEHFEW